MEIEMKEIPLYKGAGFVKIVEVMGSDEAIEAAARLSYGKGTRTSSETRSLIRYLIKHRHTSPVEQGVIRFHMKIPIFVMRQHVRHRTASMNEYSGRYSEMIDDMFLPDPIDIQQQSTTNKQGREDGLTYDTCLSSHQIMSRVFEYAKEGYKDLLNAGVAREMARIVLPVSNFTEAVWQINLHNFMHYATLRTDSHAQKEIRDLADAMVELVEPHFPICIEAWRDYQKDSKTLSSLEQKLLSSMQYTTITRQDFEKYKEEFRLSSREWNEFFTWFENL